MGNCLMQTDEFTPVDAQQQWINEHSAQTVPAESDTTLRLHKTDESGALVGTVIKKGEE